MWYLLIYVNHFVYYFDNNAHYLFINWLQDYPNHFQLVRHIVGKLGYEVCIYIYICY